MRNGPLVIDEDTGEIRRNFVRRLRGEHETLRTSVVLNYFAVENDRRVTPRCRAGWIAGMTWPAHALCGRRQVTASLRRVAVSDW